MKQILFIIKYLKYYLVAKTDHGIHSPLVFEVYNEVINTKNEYYSFDKIEGVRKKLMSTNKKINVTDYGTGSSGDKFIKEIAKRSLKNAKYGQLLFRLVNYFKPTDIFELGTSLGITTSYLASPSPKTQVTTIEGCPNIAKEAKNIFDSLRLNNINQVVGNFDTVLPKICSQYSTGNRPFVFFDGNHKKESTLNYFNQFLPMATGEAIFIFDDIHWSQEMEEAWEEIQNNKNVSITIDLFFLGMIFFKKGVSKENFILHF